MRSNKEWYTYLSEEEQDQFKVNVNDFNCIMVNFPEYMEIESLDFEDFIIDAFIWSDSKQGNYYWRSISERKIDQAITVTHDNDAPLIKSTDREIWEKTYESFYRNQFEQKCKECDRERSKRMKKQAEIINLRDRLSEMSNKLHEVKQQNLILTQQVEGLKKQIR